MKVLATLRSSASTVLAVLLMALVSTAASAQTSTVPDVNVDGTRTVSDVHPDITSDWGPYKVVKILDKARVQETVVEQQVPAPGAELTTGESMFLVVSGSGMFDDSSEMIVVVILVVLVVFFFWGWIQALKKLAARG